MNGFIEVTGTDAKKCKHLIDISKITTVSATDDGGSRVWVNGLVYVVTDSYESIIERMRRVVK